MNNLSLQKRLTRGGVFRAVPSEHAEENIVAFTYLRKQPSTLLDMLTGGRKWVKVSKGEKDQDLYRLSTSGSGDNSATVSVASGHIARAGFVHGGSEKASLYRYLTGSNLLITLTMPNNMTLTQSYEAQRDLLTGQIYKRGGTGVAERLYTYNALGIPTTRRTARQGTVRHDTFGYKRAQRADKRRTRHSALRVRL